MATLEELNTKLEQLKGQLESQRYFNYRHYGGQDNDYKYTASFDFGQTLKTGEKASGGQYQSLTGTIGDSSKDFRREHYGSVFDAFGRYTATQQSMAQTQGQIDAINRAEKARVAEEERRRKEAEAAAKKAAEEAEAAAKKAADEAAAAAKKAEKEAEQKQFEEDYKKKTQPKQGNRESDLANYDEFKGWLEKNPDPNAGMAVAQVMVPLQMPDGRIVMFNNPGSAANYQRFMKSRGITIGRPPEVMSDLSGDTPKLFVTYDELTGGGSTHDTGDNEYTDYFKLTDGTRWSYDRRTRVAIPPGAVGVDRDEWLSLPSRLTSFTDLMNAATGNTDMANTTPIKTDTQLTTALGTLAGMGVPQVTPSFQGVGAGEDIASGTGQVGDIGTVDATSASETGLAPVTPGMPDAGVGQVAGVQEVTPGIKGLGGAKAAQLTPTGPYVDMTGVEGTVSPGAMATAAQAELDPRATVQYQLGEIMSSLESGSPMPAWASPQVRKVSSIMQARGLGSSSMAGAAITQALMESGVQIAAADANKYAAIQLQNLNNKQQTALQNAATIAAMDKANLNARLQGAVTEAQALLSVDLKNLDNKQKSDTLTYSSLVQGLFKDAAEENARKQFNAKNELQVEEFFAELGSQVATANANRTAAMRQFNVGEANAMKQFNQQVKDSRDKFNANMSFAVNQSNAVWRREINTANTALQNETNRINVQNAYNASQTAMNNLWQQYRDNASWNFQKSENEAQRQHDLVTMAMQFANSNEMYDQQQKDDLLKGLGSWLTRWASGS